MGQDKYSKYTANQIMDMFHQKGWNFYARHAGISPEKTIGEHLADNLDIDTPYVLLPSANNPSDEKQVFAALEALAIRLNREMPTIRVKGMDYIILGLTLEDCCVKIHSPEGIRVNYPSFIQAINSVVDANVQ